MCKFIQRKGFLGELNPNKTAERQEVQYLFLVGGSRRATSRGTAVAAGGRGGRSRHRLAQCATPFFNYRTELELELPIFGIIHTTPCICMHNLLCSNRTPGNDYCTYSFRAGAAPTEFIGDPGTLIIMCTRGTSVKQVWVVTGPEVGIFVYARVEHVLQRTAGSGGRTDFW